MAHFVIFIAKSTRFRVMMRQYSNTKFATRDSPSSCLLQCFNNQIKDKLNAVNGVYMQRKQIFIFIE